MQKITKIIIYIALMIGFLLPILISTQVLAVNDCTTKDGAGYQTSVLPCPSGNQSGVGSILLLVINILTGGVFIAGIGGIIYGGIMYTSAGGSSNQEQVKKARSIITNTVIGLIAFALMFALLQWLVPGGIFNASGGVNVP